MKTLRWKDIRKGKLSDAQLAEIDRQVDLEVVEMNLRAIRELAGKTQIDVANASDMVQSDVSRIEQRNDHLVSTLRKYVEALGGELEVTARIGDKRVLLRGV